MNFALLADEIRGLAEGDVDSEIALADLTDEQIVQHVASCPCCDDPLVEGDQLNRLVTESTNLEDFINRVNGSQKGHPLTPEEMHVVAEVMEGAMFTATNVICALRGIEPTSDLSDIIRDHVGDFAASEDWMEFI